MRLLLLFVLFCRVVSPTADSLFPTFCECQHEAHHELKKRKGMRLDEKPAAIATTISISWHLYARGKKTPYGFPQRGGEKKKGFETYLPILLFRLLSSYELQSPLQALLSQLLHSRKQSWFFCESVNTLYCANRRDGLTFVWLVPRRQESPLPLIAYGHRRTV